MANAEFLSWERVSFQGDLWEIRLLRCPQELNLKAAKSSRSEGEGKELFVRQAGTWDPWLQSLHLNTRLLQQQNTKKLHGTKNNHMHAQLGQILDPKDTKRPINPLSLLKSLEPRQGVRSKSRVLHTPPAHNTTQGVGKETKPPLGPDPWTHPYPHRKEGRGCLPLREWTEQGNLLFILTPHCCSRGPSKAWPKFLFWSLINFY